MPSSINVGQAFAGWGHGVQFSILGVDVVNEKLDDRGVIVCGTGNVSAEPLQRSRAAERPGLERAHARVDTLVLIPTKPAGAPSCARARQRADGGACCRHGQRISSIT